MTDLAPGARVYVAGHRGLVGSAVVRRLQAEGLRNLLTATRDQLDAVDLPCRPSGQPGKR
jgi:GDP-L-fucose synthase